MNVTSHLFNILLISTTKPNSKYVRHHRPILNTTLFHTLNTVFIKGFIRSMPSGAGIITVEPNTRLIRAYDSYSALHSLSNYEIYPIVNVPFVYSCHHGVCFVVLRPIYHIPLQVLRKHSSSAKFTQVLESLTQHGCFQQYPNCCKWFRSHLM